MAVTGDAVTGRATGLPTQKAGAGAFAGAVFTFTVWLYDVCGLPGSPVPPGVAAALATLAAFAASYAMPPAPAETVLPHEDEFPLHLHG